MGKYRILCALRRLRDCVCPPIREGRLAAGAPSCPAFMLYFNGSRLRKLTCQVYIPLNHGVRWFEGLTCDFAGGFAGDALSGIHSEGVSVRRGGGWTLIASIGHNVIAETQRLGYYCSCGLHHHRRSSIHRSVERPCPDACPRVDRQFTIYFRPRGPKLRHIVGEGRCQETEKC